MPDTYAPIALFVYKRPEHTAKVLENLSQCQLADQSELYIFSDGPKRPEDEAAVTETRRVVKRRQWCKTVNVIESQVNRGLANSIISGVSDLADRHGAVIVIEDDLITAPGFLTYMNQALQYYRDEPQVMQVSGHMFPVQLRCSEDAVLLPFTTSWGWATWKRAWDLFDPAAKGWEQLKTDTNLRKRFDLNGSYPYTDMLFSQLEGKIDSWAIRWYWSVFKAKGLCVFPTSSLIDNIGMDGSGTHCGNEHTKHRSPIKKENLTRSDFKLPCELVSNTFAYEQICQFLCGQNSLVNKVFAKLRKIF